MSAVKLVQVFQDAGLPPGVLNLVTGPGGLVGNALVESPHVNGISFTGSTEVGTGINAEGARRLKKVQCEMGGKNAVILLANADMDTFRSVISCLTGNTTTPWGQTDRSPQPGVPVCLILQNSQRWPAGAAVRLKPRSKPKHRNALPLNS